ncbi:MAG: TlpA disulfide reductase family protein, partial [Rubripirellula sp.]
MPDSATPPTQTSSSPDGAVQYASWDEIRSQASATGKITVVDLWSLSCEPCLKEFPELVKLSKSSGGSVQCIAVNLDFDGRKSRPPEHYADQVSTFLTSVGADGFPTYICTTPSDDVYAAADIDSIPTVMIFGADGKSVKVFVDAGETIGFT